MKEEKNERDNNEEKEFRRKRLIKNNERMIREKNESERNRENEKEEKWKI